jgi:hypothetical protein
MKLQARVACTYGEVGAARAVSAALSPDDIKSPKGNVVTKVKGKKVTTEIKQEGEIQTLLSTLDDLLSCTSVAEKFIDLQCNRKVFHKTKSS